MSKDHGEINQSSQLELREELMLIQDQCLYTEKTHFAAEERMRRLHTRLGLPATLLAAAAAAALIGSWELLSGSLALAAALFSGAQTFFNPEAKATKHHDAGVELARIGSIARLLLGVELSGLSTDDALRRVKELHADQAAVNKIAPGTMDKDYETASKKIKARTFDRDERPNPSK